MGYRECKLFIGKARVNQLIVVGVAAEVVWKQAFHERLCSQPPPKQKLSLSDACEKVSLSPVRQGIIN